MATQKVPITVAHGDGIGPEIMNATLHILKESGTALDIDTVEIGEKVYHRGISTGIAPETWDSLKRTKVFLKAPITTPQGGGFKSLNVTIRTSLGLYANIRPCISYHPVVATKHPGMDLVIIRENEEDLYAGIEYQQTEDTVHSIKLISRQGSEKICRYAFEYAKAHGRKKVTCFTKDNIMKISDGLFHQVYENVAKQYPDIENEHWIVDIGSAKLADTPEAFDVLVLPNLYGDILSDVAAQISGSVGLAGSANIGMHGAMFEAIHGSAPRRAGQNMANPSGLLLGAVMMLVHIGQTKEATLIHNAWLRTLEDGIHTYDTFSEGVSSKKVGTKEFAEAVVKNLGKKPEKFPEKNYQESSVHNVSCDNLESLDGKADRTLIGVDFFIKLSPSPSCMEQVQKIAAKLSTEDLHLTLITNRGVKVWPDPHAETFCIDQWRCRYSSKSGKASPSDIANLYKQSAENKIDVLKTENLYMIGGAPTFSHS